MHVAKAAKGLDIAKSLNVAHHISKKLDQKKLARYQVVE